MCTVSFVAEQWRTPTSPNYIPFNLTSPDSTLARQMLDVLERLDAIDKKLGLHDCKLKEPEKQALIEELERRARARPRIRKKK